MFDIGIWELLVIAVVALLVVGPDEFPALVRKGGQWLNQARRFMSDVKSDLDQELQKVDELKQLLAKEAKIAELHEMIDPSQPAVKVKSPTDKAESLVDKGESVEKTADDAETPANSSSAANHPSSEDAHERTKKVSS